MVDSLAERETNLMHPSAQLTPAIGWKKESHFNICSALESKSMRYALMLNMAMPIKKQASHVIPSLPYLPFRGTSYNNIQIQQPGGRW